MVLAFIIWNSRTLNDINVWERSSLLESMRNGQHDLIDHEFILGGEVFTKLMYLVDGIYPSLSRFQGTETDPATKLDGNFNMDQESSQKDVERGYGVLKIKFLVLTHPITLTTGMIFITSYWPLSYCTT